MSRLLLFGSFLLAACLLPAQTQIVIAPGSLPGGTVGTPYSVTLTATGGTAPYIWSMDNCCLPPGLSLSPSGVLSGVPTETGVAEFSVRVADAAERTGFRGYDLFISPAPLTILSPSSLPPGLVGQPYSVQLQASGGFPPYTWTRTGGSLPPGLNLSSEGLIAGSPSAPGTFAFTVRVDELSEVSTFSSASGGGPRQQSASGTFTIQVSPAFTITTSSMPDATVGVAYTLSLAASGGQPPYVWSLAAGAGAFPPGLTLTPTGLISGVPSAANVYTFTVRATDSGPGSAAQSATRQLTLAVRAAELVISSAAQLPAGERNLEYSFTFAATGGQPPYSWSVQAGNLPGGLTLSPAGILSGVPQATGAFNFQVRVTDGREQSAMRDFSLEIGQELVIETSSLRQGVLGESYSQTLTASGGVPPYAWSAGQSSLPAGISLTATGVLRGTPTTTGSFPIVLQVTDSRSRRATRSLTLVIDAPTLRITTEALPDGRVGEPYRQVIQAEGGSPPLRFGITSGALAGGLSMDTSGVISGTPSADGTFQFTVQVGDELRTTVSRIYRLVIAGNLPSIAPESLPPGTAGAPYAQTLTATGGTAPYT
ncbi:MAG: putative Ig domain-containing protein, partial [Bryobacteraceae bacterium]